jgi:hypothetical protein
MLFYFLLFGGCCGIFNTHKTESNLSEKPIFYATLYAYMERNKKFIKKTNSTAYGIVPHFIHTHTDEKTWLNLRMIKCRRKEKFFSRASFPSTWAKIFINYFQNHIYEFFLHDPVAEIKSFLFHKSLFTWASTFRAKGSWHNINNDG